MKHEQKFDSGRMLRESSCGKLSGTWATSLKITTIRANSQVTILIQMLNHIRTKLEQQELPSLKELSELLKLCEHPIEAIRESALILLLHPPVNNEFAYYRWLLREILENLPQINRLPSPILELVFDLIGFLGDISDADFCSQLSRKRLNCLFKLFFAKILEKPLPVRPFLPWINPRTLTSNRWVEQKNFKRRWRLLRKTILVRHKPHAAFELTWSDLKPFSLTNNRRCTWKCAAIVKRWRLVGRVLITPGSCSDANAAACSRIRRSSDGKRGLPLPALHENAYFSGFGNISLRYMDHLIQEQAKELTAVRELAVLTSQQTRRVVLSWHNASLAAVSGWAFEDLKRQFPSDVLWQEFKKAVRSRVDSMSASASLKWGILHSLFKLWEERLVKPKVMHALWESRLRTGFESHGQEMFEKDLRSVKALLKDSEIEAICEGEIYGWCGVVSPHQRMTLEQVLSWHEERRGIWQKGLIHLTAMIVEGQNLMTMGKMPYLVLPWIDKFFISSRREGDIEYLPCLVKFLEEQGVSPLILFWEDTSHRQTPSFQLALKKYATLGLPFRGVGVFDCSQSVRTQALEYISNEHQKTDLFALRPYNDLHYPRSLYQLMRDRDYQFFRRYDSAWKDGLVFIYVGTQVFPLISVQCDVESFPGWVALGTNKYPFGIYFRNRLRKITLGEWDAGADQFSSEYAHWANLC